VSAVLLLAAAYGTVAAGRATVLEGIGVSLPRAALWPRYHYMPLALLAVLLSVALAALRDLRGSCATIRPRRGDRVTAVQLALVTAYPLTIDHHDAERRETEGVVRSIREAVAASPAGTIVSIENRSFAAAGLTVAPPGSAGVFVIYFRATRSKAGRCAPR